MHSGGGGDGGLFYMISGVRTLHSTGCQQNTSLTLTLFEARVIKRKTNNLNEGLNEKDLL